MLLLRMWLAARSGSHNMSEIVNWPYKSNIRNNSETTKEVSLLLASTLKLILPCRSSRGGSVPRTGQQCEAAGAARAPPQRCGRGPAWRRLSPQRRGLASQELPGRAARASSHTPTFHCPPQDSRWELSPLEFFIFSDKMPFVMSLGEVRLKF